MIRFLSLFITLFLVWSTLLGQNTIPFENVEESNPLYIPTDSGFVFFAAEEGKVMFARQLPHVLAEADSMIDTQTANGIVAVESEEGMEYFEYKQVDIDKLFGVKRNQTRVSKEYNASIYRTWNSYSRNRVMSYAPIQGGLSRRDYAPGIESRHPRQGGYYYGKYYENRLLVDYQFVVFEDKFAFYTSNSNHLVVFNQLGEVLSYSTLKPTEPFIYSKKHQSIYYDEVQQKFYLLNTTNFGYNWYLVDPSSGETKLLQQIKKLGKNPSWWVMDGTLYYTLAEDSNGTIYDVPLFNLNE